MLSVVCWKWKPYTDMRNHQFTAEHVNTLARMVGRNYQDDHEVVCITDEDDGLDPNIRVIELPERFKDVPNPMGEGYPRCYPRLWAFSEEFLEHIPNRFVSLDLDCVIIDDVTDIWNVESDIKFWMHSLRRPTYNGSMWAHKPGTRTQVYDEFDKYLSPLIAQRAGFRGSDQAWFNYILPREDYWNHEDGIYNWDTHLRNRNWRLPADARIVFFCGQQQPWDLAAQKRAGWIREHYR